MPNGLNITGENSKVKSYNFVLGPISVNAYVLLPDNSDGAILIDAPEGSAVQVLDFLRENKRTLSAVLLTHGHFDHAWECSLLKSKTNCKIYGHKEAEDVVLMQRKEGDFGYGIMPEMKLDCVLKDGEIFEIDSVKFESIYAPGHCAGSIMYYLPDEKRLFCGDVMFYESVGRYDLPTGNFGLLQKSIKSRIYTLPDDTEIFPGHGPETSVGHEKKFNPFISA